MKVLRILAAAAIALTASTAMAQGGPPGGAPGGPGMAQRQMEMLMQGITLTDAQKAKVDEIIAASGAESRKMMEEVQASGADPRSPEMRAKRTEITNKRNEAIKAALTPDQQAVFAKNLEAMAAAMQNRQRPPR
jgi:Spy/CpxP family protein refolding chaperone